MKERKKKVRLPSVFPRTSQHLLLTLFHVPWCISIERSPSCRARAIISPMINSATLRELLKGELKTAIPCAAAYCRSTWFVPMQKQPMETRFLASARTRALSFVLERIPMTWTSLSQSKKNRKKNEVSTGYISVSAVSSSLPVIPREAQLSHTPDLFNQLVFGQTRLVKVNLVTLVPQDILARLVHVLQEQNLDVFGRKGLELLGGQLRVEARAPL